MAGDLTGRRAAKAMGDVRAMEEQAERTNPLSGRGATPSMGLSQFRGGAMLGTERMVGAGKKGHSLMDHLKNPTEEFGGARVMGKALRKHLLGLHGGAFHKSFMDGMMAESDSEEEEEMEMKGKGMFPSGAYEGQGMKGVKGKRVNKAASARAAIVKRVMADRGVSMIEASRIVKAEGLY